MCLAARPDQASLPPLCIHKHRKHHCNIANHRKFSYIRGSLRSCAWSIRGSVCVCDSLPLCIHQHRKYHCNIPNNKRFSYVSGSLRSCAWKISGSVFDSLARSSFLPLYEHKGSIIIIYQTTRDSILLEEVSEVVRGKLAEVCLIA